MKQFREQIVRDLLLRSFDFKLTSEEQRLLKEGLNRYPRLNSDMKKVISIRTALQRKEKTGYKPGFSDRVLDRLRNIQTDNDLYFTYLIRFFRQIALVGSVLIMLFAVNNLIRGQDVSLDSLLALPQISLENTLASGLIVEGE